MCGVSDCMIVPLSTVCIQACMHWSIHPSCVDGVCWLWELVFPSVRTPCITSASGCQPKQSAAFCVNISRSSPGVGWDIIYSVVDGAACCNPPGAMKGLQWHVQTYFNSGQLHEGIDFNHVFTVTRNLLVFFCDSFITFHLSSVQTSHLSQLLLWWTQTLLMKWYPKDVNGTDRGPVLLFCWWLTSSKWLNHHVSLFPRSASP